MYKTNKYLSRRTTEYKMSSGYSSSSVVLGIIVLVITLSIVTFSETSTNYDKYKSYVQLS